ncbi:methylglyoxal synthase [Brumicola nitratireducens]|uniref:Methylglyoxal synthase n=1 Tax=Glaciecola nitratireducens (strain JCM 12485 / KCTC 12276 / FR1064) TaxID=1085623 RepID=G4QFL3_GLANF|nr:methylglyoxal synthase [Glaciecola nitratireducens]AEP28638.1 methylglyoxal synthase [Glaciecola nitratireducens FR1064]
MSVKTIALVAHDHKKADIVVWAQKNKEALALFKVVATGTTGSLLLEKVGLDITRLQSGPLGGDQQIGALIAEQKLDALFFFWDPMNPVPHDPDVKALLRLCSVWNVPVACNVSSADMLVSSPLFLDPNYKPDLPNYDK